MERAIAARPSSVLLEGLVNHLTLPPRLPGKREENLIQIEQELLLRLQDAARALHQQSNDGLSDIWDRVRYILEICKTTNARGKLDKARLSTEFQTLRLDIPLILHIAEQNAGLLVWRQLSGQDDVVVFECFEASAISEKVLASENALLWDFPGEAIAIPYAKFANAGFQESLASFLEQASTESIKRFAARAAKAGSSLAEYRDTVDPSIISQMLMTLLEANGVRVFPTLLRKRVRDDVCWAVGAEKPWRRSAFWLVVRIGIERYLCSACGDAVKVVLSEGKEGGCNGEKGRAHYKFLLCALLSDLLQDSLGHIAPELLELLKRKLARRLSKLQTDQNKAPADVKPFYSKMFSDISPKFHASIRNAVEHLENVWSDIKVRTKRPIPNLPHVADKKSCILSLPNSAKYLEQTISYHKMWHNSSAHDHQAKIFHKFEVPGDNRFRTFASRYYRLTDLEASNAELCLMRLEQKDAQSSHCTKLAARIEEYLNTVSDAYNNSPEQKSNMILSVMKLWVALDQCATALFGLLNDFHPGIRPESLDVLQLPTLSEMIHLQSVQEYLRGRCEKSSYMTIFDDPVSGCFAERYYDDSTDSQKLQELHLEIEMNAQAALQRKEIEWQELTAEFEKLEKDIATSKCAVMTDVNGAILHDDKRCRKCYLQRCSRRMKIRAHEDPLPNKASEAKAVIFELACPGSFKAYRNATWTLLCTLALPDRAPAPEPKLLLSEYSELQGHTSQVSRDVCLASPTKSFLLTHYSELRFPVDFDAVCHPNGLKLAYFDTSSKLWTSMQFRKSTFDHHFQMKLPPNSPFASMGFSVGSTSPSSYEVIASQTQCPPRLNIHEFMAYKSLFSGNTRRWPAILVELGSANLNLSSEATTSLISQLAVQAGSADERDHLRTAHKIFRDMSFCCRLMEQVSQRLDNIASNWREVHCMDMLLTLILRLCALAPRSLHRRTINLLGISKSILLKWIVQLRNEVHQSTDAAAAERFAGYSFWAALLYRRTFSVYCESFESRPLGEDQLRYFIEASITMQDNAPSNLDDLPLLTRNALIRDLKLAHKMRSLLRESLMETPGAFYSAIDALWPQPEGATPRQYSDLEHLDNPHGWVRVIVPPSEISRQQAIYYHLLEGHLIVDGQPLGKLPAKHRDSPVLEQLFGKQRLLFYPSPIIGMTYKLAFLMEGHEIHLGFRDGQPIVQARIRKAILEFIPPDIFGDPKNFDLPGSLVIGCVHWLDLKTGVMEIRRRPDIWKSKSSNWRLDTVAREAWRNRKPWSPGSVLIDPHSRLFKLIARIFDHFEYRTGLTVFQPPRWKLSVELRRLELSFYVNTSGLLHCRELQAEVDPNQDAGTWYGLESKLILRCVFNPSRRSILVPMGKVQATRDGYLVSLRVENEGNYGRFTINSVLGRLDCPAEPLLLYQKAQFHAYTSFALPDPLTGRTGTEEAIHCLRSAFCQPWTTLNAGPISTLEAISKLIPKRVYYPSGLKTMQQVTWDPNLTVSMQHDGFWPVIEGIIEKAKTLVSFSLKGEVDMLNLEFPGDPFLLKRAYWRRNLYQRADSGFPQLNPPADLQYEARHRFTKSIARLNVFETVTLIKNWSPDMCAPIDLATTFEKWPNIGGFSATFDKVLLSDLLDIQFDTLWGSLVDLCRKASPEETYRLMFVFGTVSFRADVDTDLIRTLLAFAIIESLKNLEPPQWPSYMNFRFRQLPTVPYLKELIKHCCVKYEGDERSLFNVSYKTRRKLQANQQAHESQVENDCTFLTRTSHCTMALP
ncbi:predicted protein [Uncinocarpus reesii 1704]|uniref:ubiquitinyl hydrolase 1 n=1 Tax=Uncinocarpus reesii (strain UAMH 1704) TaxID=336963 RepID=C4JF62_UNCRE|nr:uncharacterized protein UREG_02284 [Uncinocarpus reesii 1704]EEP77435.1 predicted protein [Uncinocarpus reesii 1704]